MGKYFRIRILVLFIVSEIQYQCLILPKSSWTCPVFSAYKGPFSPIKSVAQRTKTNPSLDL